MEITLAVPKKQEQEIKIFIGEGMKYFIVSTVCLIEKSVYFYPYFKLSQLEGKSVAYNATLFEDFGHLNCICHDLK